MINAGVLRRAYSRGQSIGEAAQCPGTRAATAPIQPEPGEIYVPRNGSVGD